jgi:hypothetical protein
VSYFDSKTAADWNPVVIASVCPTVEMQRIHFFVHALRHLEKACPGIGWKVSSVQPHLDDFFLAMQLGTSGKRHLQFPYPVSAWTSIRVTNARSM